MDITQLISSIEVELEATIKRRQKAKAEIQLMLDSAAQEGRASFSEAEEDRTKELFGAIDLSKAAERGIRAKLENARKVQAEDEELAQAERTVSPAARVPARQASRDDHFHVTREERTYTPQSDPRGQQFLGDVVRQFVSKDVNAAAVCHVTCRKKQLSALLVESRQRTRPEI